MVAILFLLVLFVGPGLATAGPFLVSDPYGPDSLQPTAFVVTVNGSAQQVAPVAYPDGSAYLRYDLKDLPDGEHALKVKALNAIWRTESIEEEYRIRKKDGVCSPVRDAKDRIAPSRTYPGHTGH